MLCLPVLNAPGAPRSPENRGRAPLVRQKYKLVSEERCRLSCLPCLRPHCFHAQPPSFSFSLRRRSGVDRTSLVLFFGFSISAKNLCQPTCWHVFKRGEGASSRGKRRGAGCGRGAWKSGYWYAVSDFAVSRVQGAGEGRRNAHLEMQRHVGGCIRIRARDTHARLAGRLMNQNYSWREGTDRDRGREDIRVCLQ